MRCVYADWSAGTWDVHAGGPKDAAASSGNQHPGANSRNSLLELVDDVRPGGMNPSREELLTQLAELSEADPELRFGQLIANSATLAESAKGETVWDVEDEGSLALSGDCLQTTSPKMPPRRPEPGHQFIAIGRPNWSNSLHLAKEASK
jgi:hypothetical protein